MLSLDKQGIIDAKKISQSIINNGLPFARTG
jgi:hypothetical protein